MSFALPLDPRAVSHGGMWLFYQQGAINVLASALIPTRALYICTKREAALQDLRGQLLSLCSCALDALLLVGSGARSVLLAPGTRGSLADGLKWKGSFPKQPLIEMSLAQLWVCLRVKTWG